MGWRTVYVTGRCKLDLKMNHLVVRKKDITKIHIKEISILIIDSTTVSLTTALLAELSKSKVKVIFCDEKHNPFGELMNYYNKHNTSLMVKRQIEWDPYIKQCVWTEIVKDKITKQSLLLKREGKKEWEMLDSYVDEIEFNDSTNREGHAAKVYFNSLFGMDFCRGGEDPINAALNYGYTVLLSAFNREVIKNGYVTQLGLFHDNQFNQFNLSCDLMEPFRPYVDSKVLELDGTKFDTEEKIHMLNIMDEKIRIKDREYTMQNAIEVYCRSIFDAIEKESLSLMRMCSNEL